MYSAALAVIFTAVHLYPAQGCSEPDNYVPWTPQRKTAFSQLVILAHVKGTYEDPKFDYGGGSNSYYAEAEVLCVFKGDTETIPAVLNVTEAGDIPGKCTTITLETGKTYILYLFEDIPGNGVYIHNDFTPTVADEEAIAGIKTYCGVKSEKVLGAPPDYMCPEVSGPDDCVPLPVKPEPNTEGGKMDDGIAKSKQPAEISSTGQKGSTPPPNVAPCNQASIVSLVFVIVHHFFLRSQ